MEPYRDVLADAVNVKNLELTKEVAAFGSRDTKMNSKLGARIGSKFKAMLAAQRAHEWVVRADGRGDRRHAARPISGCTPEKKAVAEAFDAWRGPVVLDATVHQQLRPPGTGRPMRLHVPDRIELTAFVAPCSCMRCMGVASRRKFDCALF